MNEYPLSLIDEENDDSSHITSSKLRKLKSLNEEDTSTNNTFNNKQKNNFKENDKQKILFDFKNKFIKENSNNLREQDKKENNIIPKEEEKKDNSSKNLMEKRDKKFSYHGKIYFYCAWIMLIYQYFSYIYLIEFPIILNNELNYIYLIRIIYFHILIILLSCSLYMTSKTNPGTTPLYWGFHIGDEDFKKKRYCLICQVFKPERTHHCSICNLCILNMDHHCPWVDNCIGFYNKKFFIQLLCYFLIISISLCFTYIPYSIDIIKALYNADKKEIFDEYNYIFLANNIILLGFSIVDFNFLKFHIKLIYSNLTTIETLDNELMKNKKYDMGFEANFKQIFGDNKLLWFLPINLPIGYPNGDGLTWPTKFDLMPLEHLNNELNNENTIENVNNIIDDKIFDTSNFTNDKKNIGNSSQTRASSTLDNTLNINRFSANYSKYNSVKRNPGNYIINTTECESTSTKKAIE